MYKKRTKSTASKTYGDYINAREELKNKGYTLKPQMSKDSFEAMYDRLKAAKKAGEIKSQPWQELLRRERYLSRGQAKALALAKKDMYNLKNVSVQSIFKADMTEIAVLGQFLNENKESGLYGGDYE